MKLVNQSIKSQIFAYQVSQTDLYFDVSSKKKQKKHFAIYLPDIKTTMTMALRLAIHKAPVFGTAHVYKAMPGRQRCSNSDTEIASILGGTSDPDGLSIRCISRNIMGILGMPSFDLDLQPNSIYSSPRKKSARIIASDSSKQQGATAACA